MIYFEDPELELAFLQGELPVAPMISVTVGDSVEITVLRCAEDVAREYEASFADAPLSEKAVRFLSEKGAKFFSDHDYDFFPEETDVISDFVPAEVKRPEPCNGGELRIFNGAEILELENTLEAELDEELCAAVVVDGKIVCAAGVCDLSETDETEIYVECNKDHRRRGYGRAAVLALCEKLISQGESPVYKTYRSNVASVALARSAGLVERSASLSVVGYSPEDFDEGND